MRKRKDPVNKIEELRAELEAARERAAQAQAKVKVLEERLLEAENLQILQDVRSVVSSPAELRELLDRIRNAGTLPGAEVTAPSLVPQLAEEGRKEVEVEHGTED